MAGAGIYAVKPLAGLAELHLTNEYQSFVPGRFGAKKLLTMEVCLHFM